MLGAGCWGERHKGFCAGRYRLARRALPVRDAPAACFVALAASAQVCVRQYRRFRDVAHVLLVENKTHLVPGTRIRAHPHSYMGVDFDC